MLRYAKNTNEAKQLLQQLKNNSNMPIFKDIDSSLQFLNKK